MIPGRAPSETAHLALIDLYKVLDKTRADKSLPEILAPSPR
ncbi:hypothetical protein ACIPK5_33635 [Streptomyces sp. NPDC086843]